MKIKVSIIVVVMSIVFSSTSYAGQWHYAKGSSAKEYNAYLKAHNEQDPDYGYKTAQKSVWMCALGLVDRLKNTRTPKWIEQDFDMNVEGKRIEEPDVDQLNYQRSFILIRFNQYRIILDNNIAGYRSGYALRYFVSTGACYLVKYR